MDCGQSVCHSVSVQRPCAFQKLLGAVQGLDYAFPSADLYSPYKFQLDLLIGNKNLACNLIIGQVTKVNRP